MAKRAQGLAEQLATELATLRTLMTSLEQAVPLIDRVEVHQMNAAVGTLQERVGRLIADMVTK